MPEKLSTYCITDHVKGVAKKTIAAKGKGMDNLTILQLITSVGKIIKWRITFYDNLIEVFQ